MKLYFYLIMFLLANNNFVFASQDEMPSDSSEEENLIEIEGDEAPIVPPPVDQISLSIEDLAFLAPFVSIEDAQAFGWNN